MKKIFLPKFRLHNQAGLDWSEIHHLQSNLKKEIDLMVIWKLVPAILLLVFVIWAIIMLCTGGRYVPIY